MNHSWCQLTSNLTRCNGTGKIAYIINCWVLCQKQVSKAWKVITPHTLSVGCNYLTLPVIPAFGTTTPPINLIKAKEACSQKLYLCLHNIIEILQLHDDLTKDWCYKLFKGWITFVCVVDINPECFVSLCCAIPKQRPDRTETMHEVVDVNTVMWVRMRDIKLRQTGVICLAFMRCV